MFLDLMIGGGVGTDHYDAEAKHHVVDAFHRLTFMSGEAARPGALTDDQQRSPDRIAEDIVRRLG